MSFSKTEVITRTITISDITAGAVTFTGPDIWVVFHHADGSFDRRVSFSALPALKQTQITSALDAIRRLALTDFVESP